MHTLSLIGIGTGNPEHLTLAAIRAINAADLVLIPRKGPEKSDLAELRRTICRDVLKSDRTLVVEFDLPTRDETGGYRAGVDSWHDDIAAKWSALIAERLPGEGRVALLIWGDPSLYDSSLRIARRLEPVPQIDVVPGITAIQSLCAAHKIPLNEIGEPFVVTTGRQLRENGWPAGADTVVVMLDQSMAFQTLDADGLHIWWGAYLSMPNELVVSGPLAEAGPRIADLRQNARAEHGWIMDTYILKRRPFA